MRKVSLKRKVQRDTSDENESASNADQNGEKTSAVEEKDKTDGKRNQKITKKNTKKSKTINKKKPPVTKFPQNEEDNEAEEEDDAEYEVEDIMDHKIEKGKKFYLIRWKGYTSNSDTWELASTLSCPDIMKNYEERENNKNDKGSKRKNGNKPISQSHKKQKISTSDEDKNDDKAEYEVLRILDVNYEKDGTRSFLIHWKGFSSAANTWEPEANLNCQSMIETFIEKRDHKFELRRTPKETKRFHTSTGLRHSKRNVPRTEYYDMDDEDSNI